MPKVQAATAGGASRLGRGRRVSTTLSEINVVPLVDVMLVLLIIFMVTAPMIQQATDVRLPVSRRASPVEGDRVNVTVPIAFRQNHILFLEKEPLKADVFQERVRQKMEGRLRKEVLLRGDRGVQLQELMQVIDRLKAAGVTVMSLVSTPPDE